jgi:hypothetical protein
MLEYFVSQPSEEQRYLATWGVMGATGFVALGVLTDGTAFVLLGLGAAALGVYCM